MSTIRALPLDAVNNFRDYGGYRTSDGRRVRSGVLWRSAQHGEASDSDLDAIHALGITRVIDLRGPSEREASPCRRHPDFSAEVWYHPEETAGLALHTEAAEGTLTADDARAAMLRLYDGIAYRENLVPMIKVYFDLLSRNDDPSLVHCVAGKDRTGFAVAMMHEALGVHRDDAMADYVATNTESRLEQRIASGAFRDLPRYARFDTDAVRALWGVEESYLATAYAAIRERSGSVDAYLTEVLELDPARREALRALYLEG
ncbi:protein tyrosine/serine phosphatase [Novosphingobium kunmingense]|uniref:Protein tyrosine/serine phosphatase n=1 Tax=Novosphingobium kunmingense TaxID=1211806 RepID=A0A2N0I340_9SPHN|nr:tyrosine-protein phosphatase [Novosphingobium kunmingense]PKB25608.1 protein tyrosine/serine phosphatase [Novosphingobium kunmingense]